MIEKTYQFNEDAHVVYARIKSAMPAEIRGSVKYDDKNLCAEISDRGVSGTLAVFGRPTELKIKIQVGFPASMIISEQTILARIENMVKQIM